MDLFKKCYMMDMAKKAKEMGIYPYFHVLESKQDAVVVMEGKRRIMLGSNNYLGLTANDQVINAAVEAAKKYGSGCSGSRFLNGTLDLHLEIEKQLADFVGVQSCVTFSTGFQSNLAIISALCGREDYIVSDKENHASIYDGCKLSYAKMVRYKHSDMDDLKRVLEQLPENAGKLIVTDGVFSMGGDICKLDKIVALAKQYEARVMVDDAHGFGVLGNGGRGTADYFGLTQDVDIIMGTFSKSLASMGGFMLAKEEVCEYVKHNSRPFIFCASLPPANCAAALEALNVLKSNPQLPQTLLDLSQYMRNGLKKKGIKIRESITPIIPLFTYDTYRTFEVTQKLYDEGVYANPVISPATPEGEALIRTSYMATHTRPILDEALDIIDIVFKREGING